MTSYLAQGQGSDSGCYEFYEVPLHGGELDSGEKPLDIAAIVASAQAGSYSLMAQGAHYSVASASPRELAQLLDVIFQLHFGLRCFPEEENDYAVGVEWKAENA